MAKELKIPEIREGFEYRSLNPDSDLYFFYTGDLVPKGMGVMLGAR